MRFPKVPIAMVVAAAWGACNSTVDGGDDDATTGGSGAANGATSGGGGAAGGTGGAGGGVCDDTVLTPADDPFQTCSNLGPVCAPICDQATAGMKTAIAGRTIKCLANECDCPTDVAVCTEKSTVCVIDRLATACADSEADAACQQAVAACGGDRATCHALLDGLTEEARSDVLTCVAQGCGAGLEACVVDALIP